MKRVDMRVYARQGYNKCTIIIGKEEGSVNDVVVILSVDEVKSLISSLDKFIEMQADNDYNVLLRGECAVAENGEIIEVFADN